MRREDLESLLEQLSEAGWRAGAFRNLETVAGGVHDAHRLRFENADIFLKATRLENAVMLADEADALTRLRATGAVIMPRPLLNGVAGEIAYLALRWIDLNPALPDAQRRLGRMLAALHRCEADRYGWDRDNHIGLTRQRNAWSDNWCEFFTDQRLGFQLRLAEKKTNDEWVRRGFDLLDVLPRMLDAYQPVASTLHGDLWSGNMAMRGDGEPVIFDPAAHYGDRECDIAMTELFGGFSPAFYSAYEEEWPLEEGYEDRRPLYQLYHVVNHVNMFGGGYAKQASTMIESLLAKFA
ncbi:MAG TPA: fructosamine kinase family protein [Gammaproteobacteria bacterium]